MTTVNQLMNKRAAILGGMGSREIQRERLEQELNMAELVWVFSEKNKTKEYENFVDGFYPGKYDYVFVLTKFISHKVWELLKKVDMGETKLIRINGSYNTENFINAVLEQAPIKQVEEVVEAPVAPVVRRLLEPAQPDTSAVATFAVETVVNDHDKTALLEWQKAFYAPTAAKAKSKVDARIKQLEAEVERLKENQLDPNLIPLMGEFHSQVTRFIDGLPAPTWLVETQDRLLPLLESYGYKPPKPETMRMAVQDEVIQTNVLFGNLFKYSKGMIKDFETVFCYDRFGACVACKRHKKIGCAPNCRVERVRGIRKHIENTLVVVKMSDPDERDEFMDRFMGDTPKPVGQK